MDRFPLKIAAVLVLLGVTTASAQVVRQLTDEKTSGVGLGAMDDAGTVVWAAGSANPLGTNPDHSSELFRFDPVTGTPVQLTDNRSGTTAAVSVSDDGMWLAFPSSADLTGDNHDRSSEVFVMSSDGLVIDQLTDDPAVNAGTSNMVVISGDASRVAFFSNTNPLGTNPDHRTELFVIDRDGTGLTQLTSTTGGSLGSLSISDDGNRVLFAHTGDLTGGNADLGREIFAIEADGTGLRQLTATPAGFDSSSAVLSGNGLTVAFQSNGDLTGGNALNQDEIFSIGWDGTGLTQVTSTVSLGLIGDPAAQLPSITDDGSLIYFHSNYSTFIPFVNFDGNFEIFRATPAGTGLTALTGSILDLGSLLPIVSGDGTRVTYYDVGTNIELQVMDGSGGSNVGLLSYDVVLNAGQSVTPDGTRVVFSRSVGLLSTSELWRVESDGSDRVPVTSFASGNPSGASVAADRETIAFAYDGDPLGTNADGSGEIFRIQADGTGLAQLTSGPADTTSGSPMISEDGSVVVFVSDADLTGFNVDLSTEIFKVASDGSGLLQLTDGLAGTTSQSPRVDATGTWVVFETDAGGTWEVHRVRTDGSGLETIASDPAADARAPDISAAGDLITFSSSFDPLGTNPDGNTEVFSYSATIPMTFQLTSTAEGSSGGVAISGDGTFVYFTSTAPVFEDDPDDPTNMFRVPATGGTIERIGTRSGAAGGLAPDTSGGSVAFSGIGDFTGGNPDALSEIWIIDGTTTPSISVSKSSPTVVTWDYESGPIRYDVIRGDVAELADGAGTVDLGAVVCLEDDSPDHDTAGFEDTDDPAPGQAFFFLYRGTQGLADGPGSYGFSSDDREREPASGGCG